MNLKARPTRYSGIRMRSRLEAKWAAFLDSLDLEWEYEPECFAGPAGQYLPDFRVGENVYLEVKGLLPDPEAVQFQMETIYLSEPSATLILVVGEPWLDAPPVPCPEWYHKSHESHRGIRVPWCGKQTNNEWEICTDGQFDYEFHIV